MKGSCGAFTRKKIATYIALINCPFIAFSASESAMAQQANGIEEVVVTATRRSTSIQDIPFNISALSGDTIEKQGLNNLNDIARTIPGMAFVDQGARGSGNNIIVRGLNTGSTGPGMSGTFKTSVATYLGETPVYVNIRTFDLERVEALIGPQGTLYGAGTLAGAIRYIPNKPQFDNFSADVWGEFSQNSEASDLSYITGTAINVPINDTFALRASVQRLEDSGFIDYNYVVREGGVSNPQPDFSNTTDVRNNLRQIEDANGEETLTARLAARWAPNDIIDATLTYWHQELDAEGRSLVHQDAMANLVDLDDYESALRYEEPNLIEDKLTTLDVNIDLGFASLTSATGVSKNEQGGQRDQTDLLLDFEYGYENFPSFSAFTREDETTETLNQEIRLVSNHSGPIQWITGVYYNHLEAEQYSSEFTPGFDTWLIETDQADINRTDDLEYYSEFFEELTERAFFGEISYETGPFTFTFGARVYDYEDEVTQGFDLPLFNTVFGGVDDGVIAPDLTTIDTEDSGSLFKGNLSYRATDDVMVYVTVSEGYRIGGINGVPACTGDENDAEQNLCALPNEVAYSPDTTLNKEIGVRSTWLEGSLVVNGSIYHTDWDQVQVPSATENGSLPITINGGSATSRGLELSATYYVNEQWVINANYAYNDAFLSEDAPGLVRNDDALSGDTLPGSPDQSASLSVDYNTSIFDNYSLNINYLGTYTGDVYTSVGARGNDNSGEVVPGYTLHNLSAAISTNDRWEARLFINNLTNKYAVTAVRADRSFIRDVNGFNLRSYGQYVTTPRTIGLAVNYSF
ncbi:TonB-dependent receptor [Marinibactrum halimedae]|uniref:TonB-dependent receptor n=1 Tax=Marinibactrum halimedae TaxID=1444977 RepID=A0AA37T4F4_9GAMM|nr:TonB-dependent receptor [Marinibactrum halimedae]MCD9458512.1 TonB-dependent receptor [Marinibactrum halimedae]GLS26625.1 TonB-dependent receptor [Marinibactrum halimedae]